MNRDEYRRHDATALAALIRQRAVSPSEVLATARALLEDSQTRCNALAELYADPDPAEDGPFHGVPMLYKDGGAHQAGRAQHAGSTLLAGHVTPATATTAPALGEYSPAQPVESALAWTATMFRPAPFAALFNTTGQPALSLPVGLSSEGLPLGVQIVARQGEETLLLRAARVVEQAQPFAGLPPGLQ